MNLTEDQVACNNVILNLISIIENDTLLSQSEMVQHQKMISKRKKELVYKLYFENKRKKEFINCKDGRVKSYNPQFIAKTEESLIDKLYDYYFNRSLERIYKEWLRRRSDLKLVANRTIKEDLRIWNQFIANSQIANMAITDIRPRHLMDLFQRWTGNGLITRKDFNNRKSLLNGIFKYAVLQELIPTNAIPSLDINQLNFKIPVPVVKSYTMEQRQLLLDYLDTLEPDAYVLAISFSFRGLFRIGEIKGLKWQSSDKNNVFIDKQLVEERELQEDFTLGKTFRAEKDPKGNPHYSKRLMPISKAIIPTLEKMKKLNPFGEYLFMFEGRPLTTVTFNVRLKKYCDAIGIPYLSSHKIRFTGASILRDKGMKSVDIMPLLGHSNLAMTEHYIGQRVNERDTSQMAQILA